MKSRLLVLSLSFTFGLVLCVTLTVRGQSTVWVSSTGATLRTDKTASASTVAELPVGTELTVLSFETPWYEVSTTSGMRGWMYRGKVSTEPPQKEEQAEGGLFSALPDSGIQSQTADTSRSIRGLSPEATAYAKETKKPVAHQKALDTVLNMMVSDADVERFLRNGRIGEYAQ